MSSRSFGNSGEGLRVLTWRRCVIRVTILGSAGQFSIPLTLNQFIIYIEGVFYIVEMSVLIGR